MRGLTNSAFAIELGVIDGQWIRLEKLDRGYVAQCELRDYIHDDKNVETHR
jgi:hypothetical protein